MEILATVFNNIANCEFREAGAGDSRQRKEPRRCAINGVAFIWSMVSLSQCNASTLLTTCPSPGQDIFVGEEAQDHDISHSFYATTIGSIYTCRSVSISIVWTKWMNCRFNCGGMATRRTRTNVFTRLSEQTSSFHFERYIYAN